MPKTPTAVSIACFGEALWDILLRGLFLGGAPLNVAYHLSRHSVRAHLVSALGRDFLGDEALRRIVSWRVESQLVTRHSDWRTGVVRASLDSAGVASYRIERRVAWDHIVVPAGLRRMRPPAALVFGSLALREPSNRHALANLVHAWPDAWRVLDLNLRAPFDRGTGVTLALKQAQFVKLNDDELARMTGAQIRSTAQLHKAARAFAITHRLDRVCVTAGAKGAGLWWDGAWFWEPARPTAVRDTVGAGDAFLAALLAARFARGASPREALARACRLGEFVAARDGATPPYYCNARGDALEPTG